MPSDLPQHLLPSTTRTSNAVSAPTTEHLTSARANAPSASGPAPQGSNRKKPRPSKTKPGKSLSKSLSTPHLRGPIMSDAEADKKRNKLGYQRISIACAHCRRRKIRCLLAEDDPEQRCQNCIRLKKDCVFYPVDQQTALEARSESSSKAAAPSGPSSTVSSSPQIGARGLGQPGQQFGGTFHGLSSDSPGGYQGLPVAPSGALPSQVGGYTPQEYGYASHRESPTQWNQPQPLPVGGHGNMQPPFPRYGNPNMAGDTAPFPENMEQAPQSAEHIQQFAYSPVQMQQPWQQQAPQPSRSISYSDYPNPNAYNPQFQQYQQHPSSSMRQAPLPSNQPDPRMVPVAPNSGAPGVQHPPYMMHQGHRSSSIPVMPTYPQAQPQMQGNWYHGAPQFGPPDEEGQQDHRGYHGRNS